MNTSMSKAVTKVLMLTVMAVALSACGGGSGTVGNPAAPANNPPAPPSGDSGATGTVGIIITDAPMDRFERILLDVNEIELIGNGAPVTVLDEPVTVDLKQLETSGELLSLEEVRAGLYTKIRLQIDKITMIDVDDNGNELERVYPRIPANGKVDLNPRGPFSVVDGETLLLQIDIDANKSIKYHATGTGEWRFRPVVFVDIGDADDFGRLTKVYGQIDEIDAEEMSFRLCQRELLSDDDSEDDYGRNEHCLIVNVFGETGVFGESGDPIDFGDLVADSFATVAGYAENKDDDRYDDDEDEYRNDDDYSDDESSEDDSSDDGSSDDDSSGEGGDRKTFEINAVVVMVGEKGTFRSFKGSVVDPLNADTGEFSIDLKPDQGIDPDGPLAALFQQGTKVFDRKGQPLDPSAIDTGVRGKFDGRLSISDSSPDVLKTALIVLDIAPESDEVLRGTIATLERGGFVLMTEEGDRCVRTEDDTDVFLITLDGDRIRSERGSLDDLDEGQSVDVYGEDEDDGCFEADTIIVDLTNAGEPGNQAPVANAGDDQEVEVGSSVMLDGSASEDPDGDDLSYTWVLDAPAESMAELTAADTATPSFTADVVGEYVAELTVSDGELSDSDSVTVESFDPNLNRPPVANAGEDQGVEVGTTVELDGRGSNDPDGNDLTYSWVLETPEESTAVLDDPSSATPTFVADLAGRYVAELTVNDGTDDSTPDEVVIVAALVEEMPPPGEPPTGD